jgi:chromosome partitioning protein
MRVGFVSLKGGVGKTALSVHTAFYFHRHGRDVQLVDGDPIESCHRWQASGDGFPFPVTYPTDPWEADTIVFDTEAHPEIEDLNALGDTLDMAVIPVTTNIDALDAALMTLPALEGRKTAVVAVVNAAPPANLSDGANVQKALRDAGLTTADTILRKRKAYEYARLEGTSVDDSGHTGGMRAWLEFERFAREVFDGL